MSRCDVPCCNKHYDVQWIAGIFSSCDQTHDGNGELMASHMVISGS